MRKKVVIVGLIVLFFVLTAPMFAAGQAEEAEEEKVILEYICFDDQQATFVWFDEVFQEYQEMNPNVTINVTGLPSSEYEKLTMLQIATGQVPDIFPMLSSQLVRVMDENMLEPLDKWLEDSDLNDRLLPLVREAGSRDGQVYAFIRALPPWVLITNEKLLNQAGIEKAPQNIEDFYEAAKAVKEKTGKWGYVAWLDYADDFNTMRSILSWLIGFGGHWGLEPYNVTINSDENVEAFTWLQKFVAEGLTPTGITERPSYDMFMKEEVAMIISGTWLPGMVQQTNPDLFLNNLGVYKIPLPTQNSLVGGGWVGIPAASKNKEAAWDLLEFMYSSENQSKWIEYSTRYGSTTDQPSQEWIDQKAPWFPIVSEVAENHVVGIGYDPVGYESYAGQFRRAMMPYVLDILQKGAPVKPTLDKAQNEVSSLLKDLSGK